MKQIIFSALLALGCVLGASAQYQYQNQNQYQYQYGQTNPNTRYQRGYTRSDGTYVQGHHKTQSNQTNLDNYSTSGNTNSYTGRRGYRARDYSNESYNYGQDREIHQGPRGGQYYYNSRGNKTYVPKRW